MIVWTVVLTCSSCSQLPLYVFSCPHVLPVVIECAMCCATCYLLLMVPVVDSACMDSLSCLLCSLFVPVLQAVCFLSLPSSETSAVTVSPSMCAVLSCLALSASVVLVLHIYLRTCVCSHQCVGLVSTANCLDCYHLLNHHLSSYQLSFNKTR